VQRATAVEVACRPEAGHHDRPLSGEQESKLTSIGVTGRAGHDECS
jgi:hypothetical protein